MEDLVSVEELLWESEEELLTEFPELLVDELLSGLTEELLFWVEIELFLLGSTVLVFLILVCTVGLVATSEEIFLVLGCCATVCKPLSLLVLLFLTLFCATVFPEFVFLNPLLPELLFL